MGKQEPVTFPGPSQLIKRPTFGSSTKGRLGALLGTIKLLSESLVETLIALSVCSLSLKDRMPSIPPPVIGVPEHRAGDMTSTIGGPSQTTIDV